MHGCAAPAMAKGGAAAGRGAGRRRGGEGATAAEPGGSTCAQIPALGGASSGREPASAIKPRPGLQPGVGGAAMHLQPAQRRRAPRSAAMLRPSATPS
jgi:hypothetical protein